LPGRLSKSYDEHDVIVTAILQANSAVACQAAYGHVAIVSGVSTVFARGEGGSAATDLAPGVRLRSGAD
jgi:hypothetical protein